ncbi:ParB/RepB/Spo0J family partition protein [Candidatus Gottesmanbacteria bacterium]|nr:ParB/RepB/Spo0J family partition protein [Candidatus Gottesmanbacteria bacterium]
MQTTPHGMEILEIDINELQPNPLQVRAVIKSESLVDLVESIKEHGVLEPLVVAKTPAGYQIVAGERRWRAAKIVGLKKLPVIVKETTAQGMLELALVENVQREDLNAIERAQGFQRLLDEFGLGVTEISKRIGKSPAYVSNTLRLLSLPDAIKDGIISGQISEGHARAIAGLGDPKLMVEAFKTILAEGASVRKAEELSRKIKTSLLHGPRSAVEHIFSSEMEDFAEKIGKLLGATASIVQTKSRAVVKMTFEGGVPETTQKIHDFFQKINVS